ncbi:hypothetical protein B0H14DRAFT_3498146 [Mycena olivaceomarginata]|nr:hypothetical protein B0H14DRAFT_3498146 [Mycena olivaceomarginata]
MAVTVTGKAVNGRKVDDRNKPYLGSLDPDAIKDSLPLSQLRSEKPVYGNDASSRWPEVIR